jgi:hypothetical protein
MSFFRSVNRDGAARNSAAAGKARQGKAAERGQGDAGKGTAKDGVAMRVDTLVRRFEWERAPLCPVGGVERGSGGRGGRQACAAVLLSRKRRATVSHIHTTRTKESTNGGGMSHSFVCPAWRGVAAAVASARLCPAPFGPLFAGLVSLNVQLSAYTLERIGRILSTTLQTQHYL